LPLFKFKVSDNKRSFKT